MKRWEIERGPAGRWVITARIAPHLRIGVLVKGPLDTKTRAVARCAIQDAWLIYCYGENDSATRTVH